MTQTHELTADTPLSVAHPVATSTYLPLLDGLRGWSILGVLLGHFFLAPMVAAQTGVTVFFFVSGFLITRLLVAEHERNGAIALGQFYLRRVFRLYPALIVMLAAFSGLVLLKGLDVVWADVASGLVYFGNYYLAYSTPAAPEEYLQVSGVLWSLSVEEHFYLVFPVAFALLVGRGSWLRFCLVASLPAVLLARMFTADEFVEAYATTHCRADSILYGCLAAVLLYRDRSEAYIRLVRTEWFGVVAGGGLLAASLVVRDPLFQRTWVYTVQGLGLMLLVPALVEGDGIRRVRQLFTHRAIVTIGKWSYSLYLFHWIALQWVVLQFEDKSLAWYLAAIPTTFALAAISYYFVERPFVGLRRRFGSNG